MPKPKASAPKALNTKAIYFAIGLAANPEPDEHSIEGLRKMLPTIQGDQLDDGSWSAWPETRPPFFGDSKDSMTALATLATASAAKWGNASTAQTRDNGVRWLSQTKSDNDPQSVALRLVLWQRVGKSLEEMAPLALQIQQRQNEDGGWSQSHEIPSDAWATGQAIYALAHAGLTISNPIVARGHQFLVKTQREDGSWPMTSRPIKPGGPGSTSLIPIIGAGSAWAVMGLVRSQ